MKQLTKKRIINTTKVLAGIGAINWGVVALFNVNLVSMIFGMSNITSLVYIFVGVSGAVVLGEVFNIFK